MNIAGFSTGGRFTYAEYAEWPDDVRYELIDGVPYMMSAPSRVHQAVAGEIFRQLSNFLKGKSCAVYIAPFDVRLFGLGDEEATVVQPDISVICDRAKLDDRGCNGAPDLIIEVLSPSSGGYDCVMKYNKYLQAGVREYWIVDPDNHMVSVNVLDAQHYRGLGYERNAAIPVHVLAGCTIELNDVFPDEETP